MKNLDKLSEGLQKAVALMIHNDESFTVERAKYEDKYILLNEDKDEVEPIDGDEERDRFMVLTESEANEKWEESLESYLEDCIYPGLPDNLRNYFDDEKWKRDARFDGRGHAINSYDGHEHEVKVGDTWYYVYQIN